MMSTVPDHVSCPGSWPHHAPGHVRRWGLHIRLLCDSLLIHLGDSRRYTRYDVDRPGSCLLPRVMTKSCPGSCPTWEPSHSSPVWFPSHTSGRFSSLHQVWCQPPRVMSPAPVYDQIMPWVMSDVGAFTFVSCMIPFSYIWEILIVTPGTMSTVPGRVSCPGSWPLPVPGHDHFMPRVIRRYTRYCSMSTTARVMSTSCPGSWSHSAPDHYLLHPSQDRDHFFS
jgi:hypothetical protein